MSLLCRRFFAKTPQQLLATKVCCCIICAAKCPCDICHSYREEKEKKKGIVGASREASMSAEELARAYYVSCQNETIHMSKREQNEYLLGVVFRALRTEICRNRFDWRFPVCIGRESVLICKKSFKHCYGLSKYKVEELMAKVSNDD